MNDFLVTEVEKCIQDSLVGPLMPFSIRKLQGMSGQRFRLLLNHLARIRVRGSYLEVGTYKGSTACSALYRNERSAILVDNWSEFGGPKKVAQRNLNNLCRNSAIRIVDSAFEDFYCGNVDEKIFIYFYDGGHSLEQQKMAVNLIDHLNFDHLIFIVDDFSWETVRLGTLEALSLLDSKVLASWTISPSEKDKLFQFGNWHNGYFICVISKVGSSHSG